MLFDGVWCQMFYVCFLECFSRNDSVVFQNEMLDQNTALNEKILVLFCQGDLKLGRGEGGRDESLRSLHLPSAAFGKIYLGRRTEDKKVEGRRNIKRDGRKKETGQGRDDGWRWPEAVRNKELREAQRVGRGEERRVVEELGGRGRATTEEL